MELEKKNPEKKLNETYIIAFILPGGQLVVQLYLLYLSCSVNLVWI